MFRRIGLWLLILNVGRSSVSYMVPGSMFELFGWSLRMSTLLDFETNKVIRPKSHASVLSGKVSQPKTDRQMHRHTDR